MFRFLALLNLIQCSNTNPPFEITDNNQISTDNELLLLFNKIKNTNILNNEECIFYDKLIDVYNIYDSTYHELLVKISEFHVLINEQPVINDSRTSEIMPIEMVNFIMQCHTTYDEISDILEKYNETLNNMLNLLFSPFFDKFFGIYEWKTVADFNTERKNFVYDQIFGVKNIVEHL